MKLSKLDIKNIARRADVLRNEGARSIRVVFFVGHNKVYEIIEFDPNKHIDNNGHWLHDSTMIDLLRTCKDSVTHFNVEGQY